MSNWALELQQFNIERIWIRGEANIVADAPSRAPWEAQLAQFLPIPDMPVRDLVHHMYMDPDGLEELVSRRRVDLTGTKEWAPIVEPRLSETEKKGYVTPGFGSTTPDFGEISDRASEVVNEYGRGRALFNTHEEWPRFPLCVLSEPIREDVRVGEELRRPMPKRPLSCYPTGIERRKDARGHNYVVHFPSEISLEGSNKKVKSVWFNANYSDDPRDAADAAWEWYKDVLC